MTTDLTPDGEGNLTGPGTQVLDTPYARLERYFAQPWTVGQAQPGTAPAAAPRGVPNPYGKGLSAFEPNTTPWVGSTPTEQGDANVTKTTIEMPQGNSHQGEPAPKIPKVPDFAGGGVADASGKVQQLIQAALQLAANNVPYVWGGTSATGVDCSGLIYYAARAAGIADFPRYVAHDYGSMGTSVSADQARPGDIVYYVEDASDPSSGHVGIYLGGGKMVAAPQTGENVQVQSVYGTPEYRRIFSDNSFAPVALPNGATTYNYNGRPYAAVVPAPKPSASPAASTVATLGGSQGGGMRAI